MASKKFRKKLATKKPVKKAAAKKKSTPENPVKKAVPGKKTAKKTAMPKGFTIKKTIPCICIENEQGWFCMKRKPNGELVKCDGPFGSKEACESHTCLS